MTETQGMQGAGDQGGQLQNQGGQSGQLGQWQPSSSGQGNAAEIEKQAFLERLKQESDKRQAMEQELETLRKDKEQRDAADMSKLEKAEKAHSDAVARAEKAEARIVAQERSGLVRDAAAAAGFADPSDAVHFIDLSEVEDEKAAKKLVDGLAKARPHLRGKQTTQPFGGLQDDESPPPDVPVDENGNPDWQLMAGQQILGQIGRQKASTGRLGRILTGGR